MEILTNPLFGAVTLLVGILLGIRVGQTSKDKEWVKREQLMRETFENSQTSNGCWVRGQIDLDPNMSDEDPTV